MKLHVGEHVEHRVAEGDGPVNALDGALRKALQPHYPAIDQRASDRLQSPRHQLQGRNRRQRARRHRMPPRARPTARKEIFGTIGVSGNIIDASWQALVDAYEYHLLHVEEAAGRG